jgi:hypothetical protein
MGPNFFVCHPSAQQLIDFNGPVVGMLRPWLTQAFYALRRLDGLLVATGTQIKAVRCARPWLKMPLLAERTGNTRLLDVRRLARANVRLEMAAATRLAGITLL